MSIDTQAARARLAAFVLTPIRARGDIDWLCTLCGSGANVWHHTTSHFTTPLCPYCYDTIIHRSPFVSVLAGVHQMLNNVDRPHAHD